MRGVQKISGGVADDAARSNGVEGEPEQTTARERLMDDGCHACRMVRHEWRKL